MLKALLLAAFAACAASKPVIATWGACPPDIKGDGSIDGIKDAMLHGLNTWFVGPVQVFRPELMGLSNNTQIPRLLDVYSTIGGNGANELGPTTDQDGYEIFSDAEIENTTQKLILDLEEYGVNLKGYDFDIESDCVSQGTTPFNDKNIANLKNLMEDHRLRGTKHWLSLEGNVALQQPDLPPPTHCAPHNPFGDSLFQTIADLYDDGHGPLAGINIMMFDNAKRDFFRNTTSPMTPGIFNMYYGRWVDRVPKGFPLNIGYPIALIDVFNTSVVEQDFTVIKQAIEIQHKRGDTDGLTLFPGLGNIKSFDQNVTRFLKIWNTVKPGQVSQIQCKTATGGPGGFCPDTDKCCDGPSGTGQSCYNPDNEDCCTTGPGAGHVCPKNKCSTRTGFICN